MIFRKTDLPGAFLIDLEPHRDERGFFSRVFCREEFRRHGIRPDVVQANISFNRTRGTLRGMHYQIEPSTESKLVSCHRGGIFDVIVDLREGSPTRLRHFGAELTEENRRILYVPAGFAHGFQTLEDDTLVFYQVGEAYKPRRERGLRFDDPELGIPWPLPVTTISPKDLSWPLLAGKDLLHASR